MGIFDFFKTAKDFYDSGYKKAYESNWDFKGAIEDYTKAIKLDPNYEEAYFQRANAKHSLKDYYGAISDYNKAIGNGYATFAGTYYSSRAISKADLKDYKGAIEDLSKSIDLTSEGTYGCASKYNKRGLLKEKIGDFKEAMTDLEKAIEIETDDYDIKEYKKSLEDFLERNLNKLPDFNSFDNNLGNDINESQNDLNNGKDKLNSKDYDGAIEEFNKVIEIEPNNASAYFYRGYSKFYKFQLIRETLINVNNTEPIDGVELILDNSRKHLLEAIYDYTTSLELNPNSITYIFRGLARQENTQEGAIEDFTKAIDIDPNNAAAFHSRGISKEKIKDYEGAMADLEKAIEIETDDNHLIEYKKSLKEFKERMRNKLAGINAVKALDKYTEELIKEIKNNIDKDDGKD